MSSPAWDGAAAGRSARWARAEALDWALFLAFAAWTLFRIWTHIPYRDELQALLIARDSGGPVSLFHNLAYEGTPGLWHLVLLPFAHAWQDPRVLDLAQSIVALGSLSLLWIGSPFSLGEKVLLSLGYFLGFEYAVLARAYGLGVLLFFLFVRLRRSPWSWLVLGLLGNVSLNFLVLAGLLGCWQFYRGERRAVGIGVFAALLAVAVLTGYPPGDTVMSVAQPGPLPARLIKTLFMMSGAVLPANWSTPQTYWNTVCTDCGPVGLLALAYLPLLGLVSLKKRRDLALVYIATYASLLLIGTVIYYGAVRQYGILYVAFVGFMWIAREEGAAPAAWPLRGWAAVSALAGIWAGFWSMQGDFSQGRAAAAWIRAHGLERALWTAYPGWAGTDLSAWLQVPTWNMQAGRWNTFIRWNYPSNVGFTPDRFAAAAKAVPASGPYYLVTVPLFEPDAQMLARLRALGISMRPIARFDHPTLGFDLYQVTQAAGAN